MITERIPDVKHGQWKLLGPFVEQIFTAKLIAPVTDRSRAPRPQNPLDEGEVSRNGDMDKNGDNTDTRAFGDAQIRLRWSSGDK